MLLKLFKISEEEVNFQLKQGMNQYHKRDQDHVIMISRSNIIMQPLNKLNLSIRFQNWWKNNQSNKHQGLVLIRYQGVVAEVQ